MGAGVHLGVHHWSLDTFLGRKFKLTVLEQQLMRPSPPGPASRLSELFGEKPGRAHRWQRGRQPWAGRGQKAERRPLRLPLIGSPFCPSPPQTVQWPHLLRLQPQGHGDTAPQGSHCPRAFAWLLSWGLPEAPPPCPLRTPPLPYSALHLPSSGSMAVPSVVSNSVTPPGSSLHGILQARIPGWAAVSSSRDPPYPGINLSLLCPPALAGRFFTTEPPDKPAFI